MKAYGFSEYYPKTRLERVSEALDSFLSLGEEKVVFLGRSPEGVRVCLSYYPKTSICVRILKILAFIFIPVLILAYIVRYLLHVCLVRFLKNAFFLDPYLPYQDKQLLLSKSYVVQEAITAAHPLFFRVPLECRRVSYSAEPKLAFDIDGNMLKLLYPKLHQEALEVAPLNFLFVPEEYRKISLSVSQAGELKLSYTLDLEKIAEEILFVFNLDHITSLDEIKENKECPPTIIEALEAVLELGQTSNWKTSVTTLDKNYCQKLKELLMLYLNSLLIENVSEQPQTQALESTMQYYTYNYSCKDSKNLWQPTMWQVILGSNQKLVLSRLAQAGVIGSYIENEKGITAFWS
ncbi:hypothetical protein DBDeUG_0816 [Chlamydia pecorum]|uniref:DUF648 domain-containing protein n=1 Tax=Chlamydia pecorum TaxID=85991 RepID=UPI0003D3DA36|nr:DUF648 domain-containing protein [Chlamydia pecorum]ETF38116.1 hypothetical protein CpecF_0802 [Chlamydia pecorum DBDeUG]UBV33314.1 hypothetical protein DBDeUG_0816 [Chlamydia pecorum]